MDATCYKRAGWGTEGDWSFVQGRLGGRAASVTLQGHTAGDRKLVQEESTQCAPAVVPGRGYTIQVWYKSTAPVSLTLFRHSAQGWSYWGDIQQQAPAADWTLATAPTPTIPDGTDFISFGLSLAIDGTLATDDYSLTEIPAPAQNTNELIINGSLADGTPTPACFMLAGWGNRQIATSLSNDVPANSPAGTRSFAISVSAYQSGDAKLIQSDAPGCAPAVTPGEQYDLKVDYKSTAAGPSGLTVFSHTVNGWQYWTDLKELPPVPGWTTGQARTPAIPNGVDRIALGCFHRRQRHLVDHQLLADQIRRSGTGPGGRAGRRRLLGNPVHRKCPCGRCIQRCSTTDACC